MKECQTLRTVDLARAAGISVQQVRNYEACGFLPAAERSPAGYRRYTAAHLRALLTARTLIAGYGWEPARQMMEAIHRGEQDAAVVVVDARHADLHRQRQAVQQTLSGLRTVSASLGQGSEPASSASQAQRSIGQAARLLGVRVSSLRFWEAQGLVTPQRDPASGYRWYGPEQMRQLEVIVLMRHSGYQAEAIRAVLDELAAGRAEQAILAAEQWLRELAEAGRRCVAAAAALWAYIERRGRDDAA